MDILDVTCDPAVDPGTGEIRILCSVHAADAGEVMNPMQCRGQVEGGVAQALGATLSSCSAAGPPSNPHFACPERLLDPGARQANSAWSFVEPAVSEQYTSNLRHALDTGTWNERHGALRQHPSMNGSLVLIRATP